MPLRLPKIVLPPLPSLNNDDLDKAFEIWRQGVSDVFARNFQEIENFPYREGFRAVRTTSATIVTATPSAFNLDTEEFDTARMHETVVDASRGTMQTAGVYVVSGQMIWKTATTAGTYRSAEIWKNGADPVVIQDIPPRQGGALATVSCATLAYFKAQDYIQLVGSHDAGVNVGTGFTSNVFPTLAAALVLEIPPPL